MDENYVTLSSKGQVILPSEIRGQLKIGKGSKLVVFIRRGWIFMKPVKKLSDLRGILKNVPKTSRELLKEVRGGWDENLEKMV